MNLIIVHEPNNSFINIDKIKSALKKTIPLIIFDKMHGCSKSKKLREHLRQK